MRIDPPGIFRDRYLVPSYDVDSTYRANLNFFFKLIQDVAGNHSHLKGCSLPMLRMEGKTWVITRTVLDIRKYPYWPQYVDVATLPLEYAGYNAPRGVVISLDGEEIARSFSNWCVLDIGNGHRPVRPDFLSGRMPPVSAKDDPYGFGSRRPKAETYDSVPDLKQLCVFRPRMGFLDSDYNGHINNISYLNAIVDALPRDYLVSHLVTQVDISWLKETHLEDDLIVYIGSADPEAFTRDGAELFARISRQTQDGEETVCNASLRFRTCPEKQRSASGDNL